MPNFSRRPPRSFLSVLRRERLRRLQQAFGEKCIEFATRSVTVTSIGVEANAAAADAAEDDLAQQGQQPLPV